MIEEDVPPEFCVIQRFCTRLGKADLVIISFHINLMNKHYLVLYRIQIVKQITLASVLFLCFLCRLSLFV